MRRLKLSMQYYAAICEQAAEAAPDEAWGIIAGVDDVSGDGRRRLPAGLFPMQNVSAEPRWNFEADPAEAKSVADEINARGWNVFLIYHSHPRTPTAPSEQDLEFSADFPDAAGFLILSLENPEEPRFYAYRLDDEGREQELELVTLSMADIGAAS